MMLEAKTIVSLGKERKRSVGKGMRGYRVGKAFYLEDDYMAVFML